jgi:Rod binding domain-containing protein
MSEVGAVGVPADIQAKGADAVSLYRAALQLEQTFLEQLTQAMNPLGDSDDSDDSADLSGSSAPYSDLIPGALAQGVADSGGIGLARTIYDQLEERRQ